MGKAFLRNAGIMD